KFEKVIDTVHRLRRERDRRGARRPSLRVNMVQYPELADHAAEFVAHWQGTVDEVQISMCDDIAGRAHGIHFERTTCYQLEQMILVTTPGDVGRCCADCEGGFVAGRVPDRTLAQIWQEGPLAELRRLHQQGRFADDPKCRDCELWKTKFVRVSPLPV